jgi:hypothetical protein
MRKSMKRPLVTAVGALTAVAVGSAGAYAYWTTTGSGVGSGSTDTAHPVTVAQLNAGTTPINMAPGDTAQSIDFSITNPMGTPQKVGTVTVSIATVKYGASWGNAGAVANGGHGDAAHACGAGDFSLVQATKVIDAEVPTGTTSYTGGGSGLQIKMLNRAYNQDDCKDVVVNLSFAVSAGS